MKKPLRQEIFKRRKSLTADEYSTLSDEVYQKLVQNGFIEGKDSVHVYYPINNEVNTIKLIKELWRKGIDVIMPRTDIAGGKLDHYLISSFDQLEKTRFNMREPKSVLPQYAGDCDLILVPGLAFDLNLNRLGYGGGYYDRFLANSQALKVAIAFDFQIKEVIPAEPHDIRMDYIVTDKKIYP